MLALELNLWRNTLGGGNAPVLDALGLTAIASYSLRQTRAAYTGPLFSASRDADSVKVDIAQGSMAAVQAAMLAHSGAGNGYAEMYDQSGNARHLTQATATERLRTATAGVWLGGPSVLSGVITRNTILANAGLMLHATAMSLVLLVKSCPVGAGTLGCFACFGGFSSSGNRMAVGLAPSTRNAAIRPAGVVRSAAPVLALNSTLSTLIITKTNTTNLSPGVLAYVDGAGGSTFDADALGSWNGDFTLGSALMTFASGGTILECHVLPDVLSAGTIAALDANMRAYNWS